MFRGFRLTAFMVGAAADELPYRETFPESSVASSPIYGFMAHEAAAIYDLVSDLGVKEASGVLLLAGTAHKGASRDRFYRRLGPWTKEEYLSGEVSKKWGARPEAVERFKVFLLAEFNLQAHLEAGMLGAPTPGGLILKTDELIASGAVEFPRAMAV